jgi:hypothetical protein
MACFKGKGKPIHSSTVQVMCARILKMIVVLSFVTVMGVESLSTRSRRKILIADNMSNVKGCTYVISKESENGTKAKLTFIGLSGQLLSGTMILIKDGNNTWKIDDLQNI